MLKFAIEKILGNDTSFIGCFPHENPPNIKNLYICRVIINTGDYGKEG